MKLFGSGPVRYDARHYRRELTACHLHITNMNRSTPYRVTFSRYIRLALPLLAVLLSACIYHAPIQQGNLLEAKDIDQITVGMTQAQVRYVLGTPMVTDPFSANRWDYVYYVKLSKMPEAKKQQLVVFFENGNVSRLERTPLEVVKADPSLQKSKGPWYKRWTKWIV